MAGLEPADTIDLRLRCLAVRVLREAVRWAEMVGLVILVAIALPVIGLLILIGWIFGDD